MSIKYRTFTDVEKAKKHLESQGMGYYGYFESQRIPALSNNDGPLFVENLCNLRLQQLQRTQKDLALVVFEWEHTQDFKKRIIKEARTCISIFELEHIQEQINEAPKGKLLKIITATLNPDLIYLTYPNYYKCSEKDWSNSLQHHKSQAYNSQIMRICDPKRTTRDEDYLDNAWDDNATPDIFGHVFATEDNTLSYVMGYSSLLNPIDFKKHALYN